MSAVRKQTPPMDLCLSGQVFFISTQVTKLEPLAYNIGLLGGKVEVFFSKDVTSLLVDDCCLNEYYFLSRELRFNCFPEEKAHPLPKLCAPNSIPPCTSRGYSLLASARNNQLNTGDNSAFRIIQRAKQLGINVTGIRQFTTFIEKRLIVPTNPRKRKPAVQKVKLLGCFVKVEDFAHKYKTFYKVLTEDPVRYLPVKPINFIHNRLMNEHRLSIPSPTNLCVNKILIRDNSPEILTFQEHSKSKINCIKPNKNISNAKLTPKSKKRTNHFCECCNVYFTDFSQHIFGEKHRLFANDPRNYNCVDDILKTLPTVQDFLRKHTRVSEPETNLEVVRVNESPIDYTMPKPTNAIIGENLKTEICEPNFNGLLKPSVGVEVFPMAKLQDTQSPVNFITVTPSPTIVNNLVNSICIPNEMKDIEKRASPIKDLTPLNTGQNKDWDGIDFDMDFDCLFDNYNNGDFDKDLVEEKFREFSEHISKNVLAGGSEKDMPVLSVFSPTKNIPNSKVSAESKPPSNNENAFIPDRLDFFSPEPKCTKTLAANSISLNTVIKTETVTNLNNVKKENSVEFAKPSISSSNLLPFKTERMFSDDSSEGNACPNNLISNVLTMISNSDKKPVEKKEVVNSLERPKERIETIQAPSVPVQPVLSNSRKPRKLSPLWSVCTLPSKSIRLRFTCLKQETVETIDSEDGDTGSFSPRSADSPGSSQSTEDTEIS